MRLIMIILILIAFACGIVKNTKGIERINVITVHFSGWPWGVPVNGYPAMLNDIRGLESVPHKFLEG